jgi:hypothetical protein
VLVFRLATSPAIEIAIFVFSLLGVNGAIWLGVKIRPKDPAKGNDQAQAKS